MNTPTPEQAFVAPTPEELAPLFPAYEVHGFIAAGGMGAVYQAQQRSLDRPVAIKILPREFGADQQFRANFEAEAKAMARLNHPNLIGVYDFGDIDGMLFIIMELVAGRSLHHSAHGTAIEQKEAARIATGICRGLAHAHQAGILHRDIKPANILLTPDAQPKIGDFGLARPIGQHDGEDEVIFGTPGYSAPEVLTNPAAVGERTDLYAVGVVLYELLTGKLPGDIWNPPSSVAHVDKAFDPIVRRATHPSPEMRYVDANEFGDELEELAKRLQGGKLRTAASSPVTVRSTSPIGTPRRPAYVPKQSSTAPVFTVIAILVLGLVGLVVVLRGDGDPPPTAAVQPVLVVPPPNPKPRESSEPKLVNIGPTLLPEGDRDDVDRPRENGEDETDRNEEPIASSDPIPAEPAPEPEPEPLPKPEPTYPEFDTVAFLDKGRFALQKKAAVIFAEIEEQHTRNLDRYQRAVERIVRRLDRRLREPAEAFVESYFEGPRETNRVPEDRPERVFPRRMSESRDELDEAYDEALARQQELADELTAALVPLQEAYISGLENQAAQLAEVGNTPAQEFLNEEANKTAASLDRFALILRGQDPDTVVPGDEDGDED